MSKPEITVTEKMYDTLLRPVITEKAMKSSENGQVTFRIPLTATKTEVKAAVEALFAPTEKRNVFAAKSENAAISKKRSLRWQKVRILILRREFKRWL